MIQLYKLVAEDVGISVEEVEKIYRMYLEDIRGQLKKTPEREIYLKGFGTIKPNIYKIKNRIRTAFRNREVERVKKLISFLRKLNYKPNPYDN